MSVPRLPPGCDWYLQRPTAADTSDPGSTVTDPLPSGPRTYTAADMTAKYRCSYETLMKAVREGVIPKPFRLGRSLRWPAGAVDRALAGEVVPSYPGPAAVRTAALR